MSFDPLNVILAKEVADKLDGLKIFRALDPKIDPSFNDQVGLMRSQAFEIAAGGGNRSGKSVPCFVRAAAFARDIPVTSITGEAIQVRPDRFRGQPLTIWFIGLQENYIGQTLHRLLFRAGAFQMIRDKVTKEWRAFRPWDPEDMKRKGECKPAPPLIPASAIEDIAWKDRAKNVFDSVVLKNGTTIYAFSSTQEVKQGDPVHYIQIDENILKEGDYVEWQMRTLDYGGYLVWSAWPQEVPNEALISLWERADAEAQLVAEGQREFPRVEKFTFSTTGNPFIPRESLDRVLDGSMGLSDEQISARIHGIASYDSAKVYPGFSEEFHNAVQPIQGVDSVSDYLRTHGHMPGVDWTHELILDPGTIKPAVLFCAVPPQSLWDGPDMVYVVYDEIYESRLDAEQLARRVADKTPPGVRFYRGVIDNRAGRQTTMGLGVPVRILYQRAFESHGIRFTNSETATFIPGNDDFSSRRMTIATLLKPLSNGRPSLRIVASRCHSTMKQLKDNRMKQANGMVLDMPLESRHQKDDCRVCVEYWGSSSPKWIPQASRKVSSQEWVDNALDRFFDQMGIDRGSSRNSVHIGPGAAA